MNRKTVIILSNDIFFSHIFTSLLQEEINNFKTITLTSIQEIDDSISAFTNAIIFLDTTLNGSSSLDIISHLRMHHLLTNYIIYFTDIQADDYIYKSYAVGANEIIIKPFDPFKICTKTTQLFTNQQSKNKSI